MKKFLIAGAVSDVGKTFVLTLLLRKTEEQIAAIKVVSCKDPINHKCPKESGCGVCISVINKPYIIHKNKDVINTPNTDTGRMVNAGATPVLWLICRQEYLNKSLSETIGLIKQRKFVLIEGNSAGKTDIPDLILMILSPDGKIKKSAREIWHKSNFFIINKTSNQNIDMILDNQKLPIDKKRVINLNTDFGIKKIISLFV